MDSRRSSTITTADGGLRVRSVLDLTIQNLGSKAQKVTWKKLYLPPNPKHLGVKYILATSVDDGGLRLMTVEAVEISELPVLGTVYGTPDYPVSENV